MRIKGHTFLDYQEKFLSLVSPLFTDSFYIKLFYWVAFHKIIDLDNPRTYNEKLQWLKLHWKQPEFTQLVDKYRVREIVKEKIGEEYLIPLLGVYDSFDEICFDELPNQFVLKTNHDSQGVIVCKDKSLFDISMARKKLSNCLKHNYYWNSREYPYRNVVRKIIAEQFMVDEQFGELRDYKFFCFKGECKFFYVATGRSKGKVTFDFYDRDLNWLPIKQGHPNAEVRPELPSNIGEMMLIAEKLSGDYPQIRVDLYNIEGRIFFGEYTIFSNGGLIPFDPAEYDELFGNYIVLPQI